MDSTLQGSEGVVIDDVLIVSIWDLAPVVHSLQSLAGLIKSQLILNLNIFRATEV